ncbi:MAG: hypothetical protein ACYC64_11365 [Armatimonadota bacterium]
MRDTMAGIARFGAYVVLATVICAGACNASIRSYTVNGLTVIHNTGDEGMYYNTPSCEVAYNTQVMRIGSNTYWTIYHSEPNKPACYGYPGDSIKSGGYTGDFTYVMPSAGFRLYGHPTDTYSTLYSPVQYGPVGWGGAGNPMVVKGRAGDNYYYAFFIGVAADDFPDRTLTHTDFRHYLFEARSLDMVNWQLRTELNGVIQWKNFNPSVNMTWRRARSIQDVNGNTIRSQVGALMNGTQGLIGSICYYNYTYYYFYTDVAADGNTYLYVRTCADVTVLNNAWSAATEIAGPLMEGMIARVAKAHGLDRWAVLYNGYKTGNTQELMLQYTQNMDVMGTGGISDLTFYDSFYLPDVYGYTYGISDKYLGLASGNGVFGQHYFMTDEYGTLTVPNQEDAQGSARGGLVTWTAFTSAVYGDDVYRAGFNVQ